jgi:hypothetical protein
MGIIKAVTPELKETFIETAKVLKGHQKRLFMARVVQSLGRGGMSFAQREFGWNEGTVRKGQHELRTGIECIDAVNQRGRKKAEEKLPKLLSDIKEIVDSESQIDATFRTNQLYTRLSAEEVRKQLVIQKGYTDEALPTAKTIGLKLNQLGYQLRTVLKSKPEKKFPRQMLSLKD